MEAMELAQQEQAAEDGEEHQGAAKRRRIEQKCGCNPVQQEQPLLPQGRARGLHQRPQRKLPVLPWAGNFTAPAGRLIWSDVPGLHEHFLRALNALHAAGADVTAGTVHKVGPRLRGCSCRMVSGVGRIPAASTSIRRQSLLCQHPPMPPHCLASCSAWAWKG